MSKFGTMLINLLAVATLALLAACGGEPAPQPAAVATAAPAPGGVSMTTCQGKTLYGSLLFFFQLRAVSS